LIVIIFLRFILMGCDMLIFVEMGVHKLLKVPKYIFLWLLTSCYDFKEYPFTCYFSNNTALDAVSAWSRAQFEDFKFFRRKKLFYVHFSFRDCSQLFQSWKKTWLMCRIEHINVTNKRSFETRKEGPVTNTYPCKVCSIM
jgi:hypothetical protein